MEAAHPGAGKATLIIVLLFTRAFSDDLKIQNYTILSQPAKQDKLPTASRSNPQQLNFTTSTILEGKQDFPHSLLLQLSHQQEQENPGSLGSPWGKNSPTQGETKWPGTKQELPDGNSILSIQTSIHSEAKPFDCWLAMRDMVWKPCSNKAVRTEK